MEKKEFQNPLSISIKGWKSIFTEVWFEIARDNIAIVSAGVAFFAFLAVFPAIMAFISIYGLATDPQEIERELLHLSAMLPHQAFEVLKQHIENFLATSSDTLGWSTIIGIVFSLWSGNNGTKSLFTGVDIAYDTIASRSYISKVGMATLFTVGGSVLLILSMALIVAFPAFIDRFGLPDTIEKIISFSRWLILAVTVIFFLCLLYQFAPARKRPKFRWVIIGAVISTFLWLLASWGFSFYVSNFANYGEVYGSISAVVILLLWFYLTSFIILLGAEINSEIVDYIQEEPGVEAPYKIKSD